MSLGTLYRDALRVALGDGKNCVCYDYSSDFAELWRRCDGSDEPALLSQCLVPQLSDECQTDIGADEHSRHKRIIIVWDGQPPAPAGSDASDDPVHKQLEHHLTPLDWALAFSIRVLKDSEICRQACFCISIIDLTAKQYEHAWAMRMRYQLLADMPWVRMFAPQVNGRTAPFQTHGPVLVPDSTSALLVHDSAWMVNVNECATPIAGSVTSGHRERLMDMARQWSASLTRSDDHHDINNVIGPWVIIGGEPELDQYPSIGALYRRLMWMGLLEGELLKDESNDVSEEPFSTGGPLDILVIDDQMHQGWHNVLQDLFGIDTDSCIVSDDHQWTPLGCEGDIDLFGCRYPSILDLLPNGENKHFTCRTFDSHPYPLEQGDPRPWMLVLDLRLHSGVEELAWFSRLLKLAKEIAEADQGSLAWLGFDQKDEIEVLDAWLKKGANREDTAYDIALSLFPRLCALRWPAVPILIFSGTGRRRLISRLAAYGNIFLVAQKPNVLGGDAAGQVEAFRTSFQGEFRKALPLVDVQRALLALERACRDPSTAGGGAAAGVTQQPVYRHLTIAFEESGDFKNDGHSAIGGVVVEVGGTSEINAQIASKAFFEALRGAGVNFYDHVPAYTEIKGAGTFYGNCIAKDTGVSTAVTSTLLAHTSCKIGAFRCLVNRKQYHTNGAAYTDGTYLEWLGATVELLLAEYLPSLGYNLNNTSLSIWFPTRSVPGVTANEAMRCDFNYNAFVGRVAETIGGYSVAYAILTKALVGRTCFSTTFDAIRSLKVRKIPYWSKKKEGSALHWYCCQCGVYAGGPKGSAARYAQNIEAAFSATVHRECRIHPGTYLAADYSVAQHLADAVLSNSETPGAFPHHELGMNNVDADLSVDVDAGEHLSDFLQVGRLFDCRREADGFKLAYRHGFFLGGIQRKQGAPHGVSKEGDFAKVPVERRLVGRIAQYAGRVSGNTLIELAGLSTRLSRDVYESRVSAVAQGAPGLQPTSSSMSSKKVVLASFKSGVTISDVVDRVQEYFSVLGISEKTLTLEGCPSKKNERVTCKVHGLTDGQIDAVKKAREMSNCPWNSVDIY